MAVSLFWPMRNLNLSFIRKQCNMDFYISTVTDAGTKKSVNQDCVFAEQFYTPIGRVAFAVLCDGMGGHECGEVASAFLVAAFAKWAYNSLPKLVSAPIEDHTIRAEWTALISQQNTQIRQYGLQHGITVGSTVTAMLLTQERYYVLNIGDSRAYEIGAEVKQITNDHTVVADEVRLGNMTQEQAESAPMKNVLTKCVGVAKSVYPDMFFGTPRKNTVYVLCSDGFRHCISTNELHEFLLVKSSHDPEQMKTQAKTLVELNKQRGEMDNISVITIFVK